MAATRRDCIAGCPLDTETVAKCACARHPPDPTGAGGCIRIPFNGIHPQGRRPTLRLVPSRRRPGGRRVRYSHGTSPGSAGRWPASPGSRAWRRGMRAGRPRSRRGPTPRLVPSRPRPGDRRFATRMERALGARAVGPHPRGAAPGGAACGRAARAPGEDQRRALFLRVRGPATAGLPTSRSSRKLAEWPLPPPLAVDTGREGG